jgi:hypothetical protein
MSISFTVSSNSGSRTYTIPDVSSDADTVMTKGIQTISGVKTFSGQLRFRNTSEVGETSELILQGSSASNEWLYFQQSGSNKWHFNGGSGGNGFNLVESSVADYRLYLSPGGNLSVGYITGDRKLDVNGTIFANACRLLSDDSLSQDLDYYESGVTASIQLSGPYTSSQNWVFTRIGKVVTVQVPMYNTTITTGSASVLTGFGVIPARFRPSSTHRQVMRMLSSTATILKAGTMDILANGTVNVYFTTTGSSWPASGTAGMYENTVTYFTA